MGLSIPRWVVPATCVVIVAAAFSAPAQAKKRFHFTHTVTVSGKIVDEWTRTAASDCGLQGTGSLTMTFAWAAAQKVTPTRNPQHRWTLDVPVNKNTVLRRDLPAQRTIGTATWVDNTTRAGSQCSPPEKACGTRAFNDKTGISGVDLKSLDFRLALPSPPSADCQIGNFETFNQPPFTPREFLLRMPSPRKLARQKTVVVRRTFVGRLTDSDEFGSIDETVTTEVVVTFKRLRR
jgi:hypothetical protein